LNTQNRTHKIQEWEESYDRDFAHNIIAVYDVQVITFIDTPQYKNIKSFISQKLKEQEERHKREIDRAWDYVCKAVLDESASKDKFIKDIK